MTIDGDYALCEQHPDASADVERGICGGWVGMEKPGAVAGPHWVPCPGRRRVDLAHPSGQGVLHAAHLLRLKTFSLAAKR